MTGHPPPSALFAAAPDALSPPLVKRSVLLAGHSTSISLEPIFWDMLKRAAQRRGLSINGLVAQIDDLRQGAAILMPDADTDAGLPALAANLSSALRVFCVLEERRLGALTRD